MYPVLHMAFKKPFRISYVHVNADRFFQVCPLKKTKLKFCTSPNCSVKSFATFVGAELLLVSSSSEASSGFWIFVFFLVNKSDVIPFMSAPALLLVPLMVQTFFIFYEPKSKSFFFCGLEFPSCLRSLPCQDGIFLSVPSLGRRLSASLCLRCCK